MKRKAILAQCDEWLAEAKKEPCTTALYSGLVRGHNGPLAAKVRKETEKLPERTHAPLCVEGL